MAKNERNYKDTLFRMVFREKQELLSLYNALNGTHYENPEQLEINTLENAVYTNFKNDISFIIEFEMNLYEHQSTYNPNMPLRNLFYVARLLENVIANRTLYASNIVNIPTPRFFVFYNGIKEQPEKTVLKLSDAYQKKVNKPELELTVTMLNINAGYNQELQQQCKTLKDYIIYVQKVRKYVNDMNIEQAVKRAVDECIEEDILSKFLVKYKAEVIQVSIFEYDEEKEMVKIRRAEYEEGVAKGVAKGLNRGKQENTVSTIRTLSKRITSEEISTLLELNDDYVKGIVALIEKEKNLSDYEIVQKMFPSSEE